MAIRPKMSQPSVSELKPKWHVIDAASGIDSTVQPGTTATLDGSSYFDKDDEVYVVVTANDGTDDSASTTSSSTLPRIDLDLTTFQV